VIAKTFPALLLILLLATPAHPSETSETVADTEAVSALIREGIRLNFAGDFDGADRVWAQLRKLDPGHAAAPVLEVDTLFWRTAFNQDDETLDPLILERLDEAEAMAAARLVERPDDVDSEMYWGQSLISRARLKVNRGSFISAGSSGEKGRVHLERAIELAPDDPDPKYALGAYYYYADAFPEAIQWLSWLWFVPSGDGPTGLRYVEEVAEKGDRNRLLARQALYDIYSFWEEDRRADGLAILEEMLVEFPENAVFRADRVFALFRLDRFAESARAAAELRAWLGKREDTFSLRPVAAVMGARAWVHVGDPERAQSTLALAGDTSRPSWIGAYELLVRGQLADLAGDRDQARKLYKQVKKLGGAKRSDRAADAADDYLDDPFSAPTVSALAE